MYASTCQYCDPQPARCVETFVTQARVRPHVEPCSEDDCEDPAAVRLHVPWADDRLVCAAHARSLARRDGVVAEPLEDAEEEFP